MKESLKDMFDRAMRKAGFRIIPVRPGPLPPSISPPAPMPPSKRAAKTVVPGQRRKRGRPR